MNEGFGTPFTLAIMKQIKQRGHQMPLEYAIRTMTPVILTLGRATLKLLPVPKLSTWLKEVWLEQLGEQLATDINAQLAVQQVTATPNALAAPSVYDGTPGPHDTSLFGSRHQTPQNAPAPLRNDISKSPFRLALQPTPPDQKRTRKGVDAPKATDVPAAKSLEHYRRAQHHTRTIFRARGGQMAEWKVSLEDCAFLFREPEHRWASRTDHKLKWSKPDYSMAGSSERAAETIERLKQARPMRESGKKSKVLSPMGRIGEEVEQELSVGEGSMVDGQGDVEMDGGAGEEDGNDSADNEEESEISEEE
ncbi:hypothetical protein MBLNU13_g09726t3 [Cladosporium sp. NU13]